MCACVNLHEEEKNIFIKLLAVDDEKKKQTENGLSGATETDVVMAKNKWQILSQHLSEVKFLHISNKT